MTQPVGINPDGMRSAAAEFDDEADHVQNILDTLQTSSASKGEPWGNDKAGKQFADGDKGYKANRDNTFNSLSKLVQTLHDNADNLRDAAKSFEDNETQVSGGG